MEQVCKSCDAVKDDIHVFLHCRVATQVWDLAPISSRPSIATMSITSLILYAPSFTVLPLLGLWVPLWSWLLWNLWKSMNKLSFKNITFSSMEIIVKSISDARECQNAQYQKRLQILEQGICGIGVLFSGGNTCEQLSPICESRNSISSAFMAEALTIRSVVVYVALLNVKSLMIMSDSLSISSFEYVSFYYVPRLSNVEVNAVAKSVHSLLNFSFRNGA
ncbi:hypothetical protein N665_0040s0006 [Sinapis alba]|nr:hypothetical protein N665_0040s0006 [Sinapis alba]